MPPIEIIIGRYVAAVALLWIATRMFAPAESEISTLRCLGVAVALTIFGNTVNRYLNPIIGDWSLLVFLGVYVFVVMGLFRLKLWRAFLITIIYILGMAGFDLLVTGNHS